jgi:hypothetical protein
MQGGLLAANQIFILFHSRPSCQNSFTDDDDDDDDDDEKVSFWVAGWVAVVQQDDKSWGLLIN